MVVRKAGGLVAWVHFPDASELFHSRPELNSGVMFCHQTKQTSWPARTTFSRAGAQTKIFGEKF